MNTRPCKFATPTHTPFAWNVPHPAPADLHRRSRGVSPAALVQELLHAFNIEGVIARVKKSATESKVEPESGDMPRPLGAVFCRGRWPSHHEHVD